jgi:hypothetical protein
MRIALNDGGVGTTVATRITTSDSVRVVSLISGATDSTGTGLRGSSFASAKDFVFTYDNTGGDGSADLRLVHRERRDGQLHREPLQRVLRQ